MKINMFKVSVPLSLLLISCSSAPEKQHPSPLNTDHIAIEVQADENREYSYTDKKAGYYYGKTHENNFGEWFAGWNIAKKRIFSDYNLYVDNQFLDRKDSKVTVYPEKIVREFKNATETFRMLDNQELLYIDIDQIKGDSIGIRLQSTLLENANVKGNVLSFSHKEIPGQVIYVSPYKNTGITYSNDILKSAATGEGFLITIGTPEKAARLISDFRRDGATWISNRQQRMNDLITVSNPTRSNSDSLDKALAWLLLTTDELVTEQQGKGIYAGLPWFNEYWGRDMFISMPGATLVSGQFDVTKEILRDFSRFQDTVANSPTKGRIPNRANLEGILYNTTDGTPRFVMQILDYVKYSGDTSFIREIYPAVVLSIDAALESHTDEKGYLLHADADTWMDVKREGIPGSPRGNRANDIQALWEQQLRAGVYFAEVMKDREHAQRWEEVATRLKRNFEKDFTTANPAFIADHLNADGSQDHQFRPNQLYTYELINNNALKMEITKKAWEELVYPWGVSSLSQSDEDFHPLHENWHYYHKDDAYHNGTVWLWNNGHAMQRMIEFNQQEIAWNLFKNMNRQALVEGAVGSLSENADAHLREGAKWAKRSGTFLQAWSNAEQLRIWYQYFLGVRPDLIKNEIVLEPKLPLEITSLNWKEKIGRGEIEGTFERTEKKTVYTYLLRGVNASLDLKFALYPSTKVEMKEGNLLTVEVSSDKLNMKVTDPKGKILLNEQVAVSEALVKEMNKQNAFFKDTKFCTPVSLKNLKATRVYHENALTY